ncbi:MAG TPA: hypothetical protein VHL09_13815 [Dehalococcoidia bacterium]|nr:hypothetical protein [Dehalococcoidia bacterium]
MTKLRWILGLVAVAATVGSLLLSGLSGPFPAYSQVGTPTVLTNTSGRALQVLDGVSGQPVWFGGAPWVIEPGAQFYSHPWGESSRFFYGGQYYHYLGSVPGTRFQFFLIEDWESNATGSAPGLLPAATATPVATATPTTPYVVSSVSYQPNCGITQVKGRVVNPDGVGRGGVQVRVSAGEWSAISNPSDSNGYWDVLLDNKPKAGSWDVAVWENNAAVSPVQRVDTNTEDCGPNGGGRQVAVVDFRRTSY